MSSAPIRPVPPSCAYENVAGSPSRTTPDPAPSRPSLDAVLPDRSARRVPKGSPDGCGNPIPGRRRGGKLAALEIEDHQSTVLVDAQNGGRTFLLRYDPKRATLPFVVRHFRPKMADNGRVHPVFAPSPIRDQVGGGSCEPRLTQQEDDLATVVGAVIGHMIQYIVEAPLGIAHSGCCDRRP